MGMEPMLDPSSSSCVKHPMTGGEHVCGDCGHLFCEDCVVHPFGTHRPPMCITCALERGGVRRTATGRPKLTRRSIKQRLRLQAERDATPAPAPAPAPDDEPDAWLEGTMDPASVPGAWRQQY